MGLFREYLAGFIAVEEVEAVTIASTRAQRGIEWLSDPQETASD